MRASLGERRRGEGGRGSGAGAGRLRRILHRVVVGMVVALVAFVAWQLWTWPDVGALEEAAPESWAFLERARSAGRQPVHRWVPYEQISDQLKIAVLVAEDIDFFAHSGFDLEELERAVSEAWRGERELRGASTLTQQLAKNLWLSPSRNPWRKLEEAILTWQLERTLAKRRILELYLNVVEFGPGAFGAAAAAERYFDTRAADLSPRQAALLAASLPHSAWHPGHESSAYLEHVERIERRSRRAADWLRREL